MKKHTGIYMKYFNFGEQDFIPCEVCSAQAVDVHHIEFKSRRGKDEINNLIGLCRKCHDRAHGKDQEVFFGEEYLKEQHYNYLKDV